MLSAPSRVSDEWQWSLTDPDKGVVEVAAVLSDQDAVHVTVGKTRIDGREDGRVLVEGQYFRANGAVPGVGSAVRSARPVYTVQASRTSAALTGVEPRLVAPSNSTVCGESQRISLGPLKSIEGQHDPKTGGRTPVVSTSRSRPT